MRLLNGWHAAALLLAAILIASPAAAESDQIYQWRDENGVLRFSDRPPEEVPEGNIETAPEIPYDAEKDRKRQARTQEESEDYIEKGEMRRARQQEMQRREKQRQQREQQRLEAQRQAEEAQRQAEMEAKKNRKSWAKRQRVRSSEGGSGGSDP